MTCQSLATCHWTSSPMPTSQPSGENKTEFRTTPGFNYPPRGRKTALKTFLPCVIIHRTDTKRISWLGTSGKCTGQRLGHRDGLERAGEVQGGSTTQLLRKATFYEKSANEHRRSNREAKAFQGTYQQHQCAVESA